MKPRLPAPLPSPSMSTPLSYPLTLPLSLPQHLLFCGYKTFRKRSRVIADFCLHQLHACICMQAMFAYYCTHYTFADYCKISKFNKSEMLMTDILVKRRLVVVVAARDGGGHFMGPFSATAGTRQPVSSEWNRRDAVWREGGQETEAETSVIILPSEDKT